MWFDADAFDHDMTEQQLLGNVRLIQDERKFIDLERSVGFFTTECEIFRRDQRPWELGVRIRHTRRDGRTANAFDVLFDHAERCRDDPTNNRTSSQSTGTTKETCSNVANELNGLS